MTKLLTLVFRGMYYNCFCLFVIVVCFCFLEYLVVYFFGQASSLLPVGFAFNAVKLTYYESEEVEKCAPVDRF